MMLRSIMGLGEYLSTLFLVDVRVDPEEPISVVKLLKNFRCHDAILKYPNEKFYAGELVPSASYSLIDTYANSPLLPTSNFPVVFHSVSGKDEREASSPSFFNIDEVLQVKAYVQKLKADRNIRTSAFLLIALLSTPCI
jgi:AAA domain